LELGLDGAARGRTRDVKPGVPLEGRFCAWAVEDEEEGSGVGSVTVRGGVVYCDLAAS